MCNSDSGGFRHVQPNSPPPKKRAPTRGAANFCMPKIMGEPPVNESDEQIKVTSFFRSDTRHIDGND